MQFFEMLRNFKHFVLTNKKSVIKLSRRINEARGRLFLRHLPPFFNDLTQKRIGIKNKEEFLNDKIAGNILKARRFL